MKTWKIVTGVVLIDLCALVAMVSIPFMSGCGSMDAEVNAKRPEKDESIPALASKPIKSYFFDEKTATNRAWHRQYFIDEVEISGNRYLVLYDFSSGRVVTMIPAKQ